MKYTQQTFWDEKAQHYPLYNDPDLQRDVTKALDFLSEIYRYEDAKRVLDIGCGTGAFTIPLSQTASYVYGIDLSQEMLERLKGYGAKNIDVACTTWREVYQKRDIYKAFDLVIASMTPAVKSQEDFEAMSYASSGFCLFMGWHGKKENLFYKELCNGHGYGYEPTVNQALACYEIVSSLGMNPLLFSFETSWENRVSLDEAKKYGYDFFQSEKREINPRVLEDVIKTFQQEDGKVSLKTEATKGVVVWKSSLKVHL